MRDKIVFKVCFTAIMISLACVFDFASKFIPLFSWMKGGSISIAMLPLIVCGVVCGFYFSLAGGILYGIINCFVIDNFGFLPYSFILDYIISFAGVSIVCLFRGKIKDSKKGYLILGIALAFLIRFIAHGFSGVINATVWGYDQKFLEGLFGAGKGNIIYLYIYSFLIYNLPYLLISCILCSIIGLVSYKILFLNYIEN